MRGALAFLVLIGAATASYATMPVLTEKPNPPALQACQAWAGKQDDDAIDMWGTQESGGSSRDLAISRLTSVCMGDEAPEIVGFYSGAGAADAYCSKHSKAGICTGRGSKDASATEAPVAPTWHGDGTLVEYGVEGTDNRSIRIMCDKGKLFAAGPWDGGGKGKSKVVTFEAHGLKQTFPVSIFEAGDGDNYEAKIDSNTSLIGGLMLGENVTVYEKGKSVVPGRGSQHLLATLMGSCRRKK